MRDARCVQGGEVVRRRDRGQRISLSASEHLGVERPGSVRPGRGHALSAPQEWGGTPGESRDRARLAPANNAQGVAKAGGPAGKGKWTSAPPDFPRPAVIVPPCACTIP